MFQSSHLQTNKPKKQPKIAIVIPVYNVGAYLHECFDSILSQSHTNFTVFAVNDGSTDESGAILDSYAAKDNRIVVLHQKNSGQGIARNLALDIIDKDGTFDYVSFIDGDDKVAPDFLSHLAQSANTNHSDITICGFFKFDDEGHTTLEGQLKPKADLDKDEFVELIFSQLRWKHVCGAGGMVCTKLFSASTIKGIRFPTERDLVEDELFCLLTALTANKISYLPEILYGYRERPNSSSRNERFMLQHFKCRHHCINIAKKISNRSELVVVAAFTQSTLRLLKTTNDIPNINLREYKALIEKASKEGFLDKKTVKLYTLFCEHPKIARIYFGQKKFINSLKFWKRSTKN